MNMIIITDMENNTFKIIPGFENYCINREGVVKALPKIRKGNLSCLKNHSGDPRKSKRKYKERILKLAFKQRYWYVNLTRDGTKKDYMVHRLVYMTFVGPIPDGMVIDHIDGNTRNNSVNNLRCVTLSQNRQNPNTAYKNFKGVLQVDKKTNQIINEFPSIAYAMMYLGKYNKSGDNSHIGDVCNGKRETCYGYKWKWKEVTD